MCSSDLIAVLDPNASAPSPGSRYVMRAAGWYAVGNVTRSGLGLGGDSEIYTHDLGLYIESTSPPSSAPTGFCIALESFEPSNLDRPI